MFNVDRIYSQNSPKSGMTQWYFQAREGNIGPYRSRQQAETMLKKFIQSCLETGQTGGRDGATQKPGLQLNLLMNDELQGDLNWY